LPGLGVADAALAGAAAFDDVRLDSALEQARV
jgi:hypothetical protein